MQGYVQDRFRKQKRHQEQILQHCSSHPSSHDNSRFGSPERGSSLQPWKPAGSISVHATGTSENGSFHAPLHQGQQSRSRPPSPLLHRSSCSSEALKAYNNKENAVRSSRIFKSQETSAPPTLRPQRRAESNSSNSGVVDLRPALKALNSACNAQFGGAGASANSGTRANARSVSKAQLDCQQGIKSRSSIFKPHASTSSSRSNRNTHQPVATSSFSVILAGNGSTHQDCGSDAAAAMAGGRTMLWQPLACQPPNNGADQQRSPWRQVAPGNSPAAMRYASQLQCSSSSSEQQASSAVSSSESVRLRHTTPLDLRQQQVQQQLRQSCQQLQELARLLSSPQQGGISQDNLLAAGNSSAGSTSRQCAGSSSGFVSSPDFAAHTRSPLTAAGAASFAASCDSTSLGAALQAAEVRLGLPSESDDGFGMSTLQQLASAISQTAASSTSLLDETAEQNSAAQKLPGSSCISSLGSVNSQRSAPSPDDCITPTARACTSRAARLFEDSPVETVSSPPPSTAAQVQAKQEFQQHLLRCSSPSGAAAAASAAASYKELLNKCQALAHNSNAAWTQLNRYHRQRIAGPLQGGTTPGPSCRPLSRMAGSSRQQQQQLFSSLPVTPSRTSTAGLPSNVRLSTPAHLASIRAFSMFPCTLQLPGSPARTPVAAAVETCQLASASGFATQLGPGILGNSTACGTTAWHGQPASPAWSVYQTPSAPDEACPVSPSRQPASCKPAQVQAACTQTSPPCGSSSSKPAAQQSPQPSPWTEWWRGLKGGAATAGHSRSPPVRPRMLFCQEEDAAAAAAAAAAGASPAAAAKHAADDLTGPAGFPFGCCSATKAGSTGTLQEEPAPAGCCQQAVGRLSPISLAVEDADLQRADNDGHIAPSPAWSVHTNWAAVGHEEDAAAGGLRSMAEVVEAAAAAAAAASVSPDSCADTSVKTPDMCTAPGAAIASSRPRTAEGRLPLQAVADKQAQPQSQPAAADTPGISSIDGLQTMSPAEAVAALTRLAHRLKACMDQAALAGLAGGVAPVISRGDVGMIVPSPVVGQGGSAVGRWQQGGRSHGH